MGLIIAIAGSTVSIVGVVIAMMFWVKSESNMLQNVQREDRKDLLQISKNIENAIHEMHLENKDFHYRLLEIEKNRK